MNIVFREEAYEDLDAIAAFRAKSSVSFAKLIVLNILSGISRLKKFPHLGREIPAGQARHLVIMRRYSVVYVVKESHNIIDIVSIFHEKELRKQRRLSPPKKKTTRKKKAR